MTKAFLFRISLEPLQSLEQITSTLLDHGGEHCITLPEYQFERFKTDYTQKRS